MAQDRILNFLQKIEDFDTFIGYKLLRPLMEKYGIDMKITTTPEERVFDLSQLMIEMELDGGIAEMAFALGGDDGDLDEVAEAIQNWRFFKACDKSIRITKIPESDIVPEDIRELWKGVELKAFQLEDGRYAMPMVHAVSELGKKYPQTIGWFKENWDCIDLPIMSFGAGEVEILQ